MDRFSYDTDDREALIADLAGKKLATRLAQLRDGDATVLREVSNSVLDYLSHAEDLGDLVQGAVAPSTARFVLGKTFGDVVLAVMTGEAEADAIAEVDAMEQRRAESALENSASMRIWNRLFSREASV